MTQKKKTVAHPNKRNAKRNEASRKKSSNKKVFFLLKFIPKSRKSIIKTALALVGFIVIAGTIPFPYTFTKSASVPFRVVSKDYAGLEMGNSKVTQEGRDGRKTIDVKSQQSIWGILFGLQPLHQKEIATKITKKPTDKQIANGTRKYQYMLCSNGSYRYFTDTEFKDPSTGFTSRSKDYCKLNNHGVKLKLADSSAGTVNNQNTPQISHNVTVPRGCRKSVIPFKVEYQYTSTMQGGTQKVASQGINGYTLSCAGTSDITLDPLNQLVFVGIGKTNAETQAERDAEEVKELQAQAEKQAERLRNYRSCVSQIEAQQSMGYAVSISQCKRWL